MNNGKLSVIKYYSFTSEIFIGPLFNSLSGKERLFKIKTSGF